MFSTAAAVLTHNPFNAIVLALGFNPYRKLVQGDIPPGGYPPPCRIGSGVGYGIVLVFTFSLGGDPHGEEYFGEFSR